MKPSLAQGLTYRLSFTVPASKTVPHLYPESSLFQEMPAVLATGYLIGLLEWACIEAIRPHLDWPQEQSLGTHVNFSHLAATPPGHTITVDVRLDKVEGRRLSFTVSAHDGDELISEGTHERHVIDVQRFNEKITKKESDRRRRAGATQACAGLAADLSPRFGAATRKLAAVNPVLLAKNSRALTTRGCVDDAHRLCHW